MENTGRRSDECSSVLQVAEPAADRDREISLIIHTDPRGQTQQSSAAHLVVSRLPSPYLNPMAPSLRFISLTLTLTYFLQRLVDEKVQS